MIPDFISAIYLWITGKLGKVWGSWYVPICLFILLVAISVLFVKIAETAQDKPPLPPAPLTATLEYVVEIENLKARLTAAEANILAVAGAINKVSAALENIKPPPGLGNLATKGELELLRLEVKALGQELTCVAEIYGHYSEVFDLRLDELKLAVEEWEEELTAHTDNTTIHKEVLK